MAKAIEDPVTEGKGREKWSNQIEFFLSCLGYAVGLGNVWRFPYLCYKNGGGAFLIPYTVMLAFCALPIFFIELALGQFHSTGPNVLFRHICPIFTGIGYAMLAVTFYVNIYYNEIMAWSIYYTYASFSSRLGWQYCGNEWNSKECFNSEQNEKCQSRNETYWNNTCYDVRSFCESIPNVSYFNTTHCINDTTSVAVKTEKATRRVSPSEDYYMNRALVASSGFEDFGDLQGHLVVCLFLAWLLVALCLLKGVKSSGKVVYFTALFPYVVLVILLIRGVTLEGAYEGIIFYIVPNFERLKDSGVWIDAATQIFYSLGPAFGSLLTLSSYNKFNNNCMRDAILVSVCNCATSVFAGFVIFSIVGFMAHSLDVPVSQVVRSGQGLAFIAYPEAVAKMPLSQLWAVLFFLMLLTLGLDSQFAMVETLITAINDEWPKTRIYKSKTVVAACLLSFLLGLPLCCRGGIYLFTLIDSYSASWSLLVICLCEFAVVAWIYGVNRFCDDVESMLGYRPNWYWKSCWLFISPALIVGILGFTFAEFRTVSYGSYEFPRLANVMGWLMASSSVALIPIFALVQIYQARRDGKSIASLLQPSDKWGPSDALTNTIAMELKSSEKNGVENRSFSAE